MVMIYNATITEALKALSELSFGIETTIQNKNNDITTIECELNEWDNYPESIKAECLEGTRGDYLISESGIVLMDNGYQKENIFKVVEGEL